MTEPESVAGATTAASASVALAATIVGASSTAPAAEDSPLTRGALMGRYFVLGTLGAGGMGVVYAAYDPDLDRKVALKVLRTTAADAEARARLQREARAMARVSDRHVVAVFDVGSHRGEVFIAMELVKGRTLRAWLAERPRARGEIVRMFVQAGRGLAAAHAAEIVHRDFKPENVLVDANDRALVTDFGLARPQKSVLDSDTATIAAQRPASSDALTEHGAVVGTPAYMAPEQIMGSAAEERSDQFSFCVALWEALYGERPFQADNLIDLAARLKAGDLREPQRGADVSKVLHRALRRGLAREPAQRWPSMETLLVELAKDPTAVADTRSSCSASSRSGSGASRGTASTGGEVRRRAGRRVRVSVSPGTTQIGSRYGPRSLGQRWATQRRPGPGWNRGSTATQRHGGRRRPKRACRRTSRANSFTTTTS